MKLIFLVICVFFNTFTTANESSNFIVGGSDATIREFPYMAGVLNFGLASCGGSIINPRSVLTVKNSLRNIYITKLVWRNFNFQAAHCFLSSIPGSVSVSVGSSRRRGQGGQTFRALRVLVHPDYKTTSEPFFIEADIAVIRTVTRITFSPLIQPIPLGREFVPAGEQVLLTGWGLLGDVSEELVSMFIRN